ncbi:NAD(P)-dependent alcohol dehydrogenase [Rapidithrix thailandica]|uniref:NAD(P)-dependent alcohol dehydrogenase n=1 Tax=Rapidithrix thailandica TaxID=413964 RepID=A0AAW9SAL1_9BACT
MKTIEIKKDFGLENISLEEKAKPQIKAHEVLVKVKAVSINQLDLMVAKGIYDETVPRVLGSDAAGVVEQVGADVQHLQIGDTVATHFIQAWQDGALKPSDAFGKRLGVDAPGVFSEYIALPESSFVKIPQNLHPEEAATLPIAGLTAWNALVTTGQLKAGQTVLLQGTGGVSIFALQFAKAMGAKVIITSSSDEKLEKCKTLGADATLNYRTHENWHEKVSELTGGEGVDLALEMSWAGINKTLQAIKLGGNISVVGLLEGVDANVSAQLMISKGATIKAVQVGSKASYIDMNKAIELNSIQPVIDRVFPLAEFQQAFQYMDQGKHFGKVVIRF